MKATKPASANKNKAELKDRKRTLSRLMAVQIFYQYEFLGKNQKISDLKNDLVDHYALEIDEEVKSYRNKIEENLIDNLLNGIANDLENIDKEISEICKNNDNILQQILRFASFELKYAKDIPFKVIINEYVDLTAYFFDKQKIMFVNATLENLAKKYREEEFTKNDK